MGAEYSTLITSPQINRRQYRLRSIKLLADTYGNLFPETKALIIAI